MDASGKEIRFLPLILFCTVRLSTEAASELSDGYIFFPHWPPSRAVFDAAVMMVHHSSGKILAGSFAARLSAQPSKRQASEQNRLRMLHDQLISIEAFRAR